MRWDPNIKMHVSCGTLAYVAPEVLPYTALIHTLDMRG